VYHIFIDNLFTTVPLLQYLKSINVACTGTARDSRYSRIHPQLDELFNADRAKDKIPYGWKLVGGRPVDDWEKGVMQFVLKDIQAFRMLSNHFDGSEWPVEVRRKRPKQQHSTAHRFFGDNGWQWVRLPAITHFYNMHMNGVDVGDQLHAFNRYGHRICRGIRQSIFLNFYLEVILSNCHIIRNENLERLTIKKATQREFRNQVVNALISAYLRDAALDYYHAKRTPKAVSLNTKPALPGFCKLTRLPKRALCAVCSHRELQRRIPQLEEAFPITQIRKTSFGCSSCSIPVCTGSQCWNLWHRLPGLQRSEVLFWWDGKKKA